MDTVSLMQTSTRGRVRASSWPWIEASVSLSERARPSRVGIHRESWTIDRPTLTSPTSSMRICTIIARNYLAQARVLAESYAAHNGGGPTTVLVVDDPERSLDDAHEPFDIVRPDELGIERFKGM